MKQTHYTLAVLFLIALSFSCKKIETVDTPISTNLTTLFTASFTASAHPTSGTVTLSKDASGKKFLVFKDFKTDSGPDLRVYLSEDLKATNFSEISNKVNNGTYQLEVASTVDTDKKKKVLIWCKQFSVLFGSADLK